MDGADNDMVPSPRPHPTTDAGEIRTASNSFVGSRTALPRATISSWPRITAAFNAGNHNYKDHMTSKHRVLPTCMDVHFDIRLGTGTGTLLPRRCACGRRLGADDPTYEEGGAAWILGVTWTH